MAKKKISKKKYSDGWVKSNLKALFSIFSSAKKQAGESDDMQNVESRIDMKLAQRLDSAGASELAKEVSELSETKHGLFAKIFAGFSSKPLMYRIGVVGGGFISVIVLFGLLAFVLVWYRGANLPFLNLLDEQTPPVLSMKKEVETQYGVGAEDNTFTINTDGDVKFRSFGITNKVVVEPDLDYSIELSNNRKSLEIVAEEAMEPGTEYRVTLRAGTMFEDGSSLENDLTWVFKTEPTFAVTGITPRNSSTSAPVDTTIEVEFNYEELDTGEFEKYFEIVPDIDGKLQREGKKMVFMPSKKLVGGTEYRVRVKEGFTNERGEVLTKSYRSVFRVSKYDSKNKYVEQPQLYWSDQSPILSVSQDLWIGLWSYKITSDIKYTLYSADVEAVIDTMSDYEWEFTEKPDSSFLKKVKSFTRSPSGSEFFKVDFPGYGIYLIEATNSQYGRPLYKYVVYSPIGIVTSDAQDSSRVWAFNMNDKEPQDGVGVSYYDLDESSSDVCDITTNGSGYADCDVGGIDLIIADYSGNYAVSTSYAEGLYGQWYGGDFWWFDGVNNSEYRSFIYTDKPVYRGGETVQFKAIVRKENDMEFDLVGEKSVGVTVGSGDYYWDSYKQVPIYEEEYKVSGDFGTITGSFDLPANLESGTQSLKVILDGETIGSQSFSVEDYIKPRNTFEMSINKTLAFSGDKVHVDIYAKDYSGDPATGSSVKLGIYKSEIKDSNWFDDYNEFDRRLLSKIGSSNVSEVTLKMNSQGYASYDFNVNVGSYGSNLGVYTVYIWSSDYYSTYDSESLAVADSKVALFAQPDKFSFEEGGDVDVNFRSVELWDFDKEGGLGVNVGSVVRQWYTLEQVGQYYDPATKSTKPYYESVKHTETIAQNVDLTMDSDGLGELELNDLDYGSYTINTSYYKDGQNISRIFEDVFYVFESDSVGLYNEWGAEEKFSIYLENENYKVGDTAKINIKTVLEGKGLYLIQRGDVYDWKIVDFTDGLVSIKQEITQDMAPAVNVCVWGIDEYTSSDSNPESPVSRKYLTNVFESECKSIEVSSNYGKLNVEVTSDKSSYEPGDKVELDVNVTNGDGKGVSAEVSIDVIDRALMDMVRQDYGDAGYGIYEGFYKVINQWAKVRGSMNRYTYAGANAEAGFGAGGGGEERKTFADVAYWSGKVETSSSGKASVEFNLPDNMTTWVVRAAAVTEDTWVGEGDVEFVAHKDVSIYAKIPRYIRSDDEWVVDLELKNYSGKAVSTSLDIECDNCKNTSYKKNVSLPAGKRISEEFRVVANDGAKNVTLKASLGNNQKSYDSVRWSVPVIPDGFMTSSTVSALMTEGDEDEDIKFSIPEDSLVDDAKLQLSFARSFVNEWALVEVDPSISSSVELSSSIIHNSVFSQYHSQIHPSQSKDFYDKRIRSAYDMLVANQSDNGGFGWFDYDAVNYELSAYVGVALGRAVDCGAIEKDGVTGNLRKYLWSGLESGETTIEEKAFGAYALAMLGDSDVLPYAIWLKNSSGEYKDSPLAVAYVMLALQRLDSVGDAGELIPLLESLAKVTKRSATWTVMDSDTLISESTDYSTALVYLAIYQYEQTDLGEFARNWLVDNPVQVQGNSVDAVGIFYALTVANLDNLEARKGVNKVTVKVNGEDVKTFDVGGDDEWIGKMEMTVNSSYLKSGDNKVEIERSGKGDLYVVGNVTYYSSDGTGDSEFEVRRYIKDFYSGSVKSSFKKGDVVLVRTEIKADRDGYNLVVHDFIPAGFEPVQYRLGGYGYDFISKWWKWNDGDYVNRYGSVAQDHVTFSEYQIKDGDVYVFEYPAVAVFEGEYSGAGAQGYLLGFDDVGGSVGTDVLMIKE